MKMFQIQCPNIFKSFPSQIILNLLAENGKLPVSNKNERKKKIGRMWNEIWLIQFWENDEKIAFISDRKWLFQ